VMTLAAAFLLAVVISLLLTPFGTRAAWATGCLDHPEARKLHTSATALLGGAVVFVSALIAWSATLASRPPSGDADVAFVLGGAIIALGIGLWDDCIGMEPKIKLLGQTTAATML